MSVCSCYFVFRLCFWHLTVKRIVSTNMRLRFLVFLLLMRYLCILNLLQFSLFFESLDFHSPVFNLQLRFHFDVGILPKLILNFHFLNILILITPLHLFLIQWRHHYLFIFPSCWIHHLVHWGLSGPSCINCSGSKYFQLVLLLFLQTLKLKT